MKHSLLSQIFLTVLLLGVGILIVAQFRVQRRLRVVTFDRDEQAVLLSELVDANAKLRDEIESLDAQRAAYQENHRGTVLEDFVAELNRVRVINGMVEVSGPGLELLVDGPLQALDLQDLINELRNAGAEAIALNDHRLVVHSVFVVDASGAMIVDGQSISRPYRFTVIGDPSTIETALFRPGGLISLFQQTYPNLVVSSTHHSRLVLGVHRPQADLEFARPVE